MLVTLEGVDGAGKSTVLDGLRAHYPDAVYTSEPTDTWRGDAVRRSLSSEDSHPLADLFLFVSDHAQHLAEVVEPSLEEDELVVSDRYTDSRYAYQSVTLADVVDEPLDYLRTVHEPWTRAPDLTLLLDVDVDLALSRLDDRMKYEDRDHLERVRENYLEIARREPGRVEVVDAARPADEVVTRCVDAIDRER
ncbi:MAG: dTMP kinase [Halobacteriota archaeon]